MFPIQYQLIFLNYCFVYSICKFSVLTTSSRLTAWPLCGLEGKGDWGGALSPAVPSSPFFNMPLQFPVPPSACSLTEPPAAAYRKDGDK